MTTPGGSAPDGAYVVGDGRGFGQDQDHGAGTEAHVKAQMKAPVINPWELAQFNFWDLFAQPKFDAVADLRDGQIAYNDRVELLNQVSGFGASVMGQNWLVTLSAWVRVPFTLQVGPSKRAGLDASAGRLILKAGGLWRVDTLMNCLGYTRQAIPLGPGSTQYNYYPLAVTYLLEVVNGAGVVLTSREFKAQTGHNKIEFAPIPPTVATSTAFSHTFVLDNINEADSATWAYVRVSMRAIDVSGLGTSSSCSVYGGTSKSALAATRWSKDSGPAGSPTVGNGGTLT